MVSFSGNGGLGSTASAYCQDDSTGGRCLRQYELVRAGYVVLVRPPSLSNIAGPSRRHLASGVLVPIGNMYWLLVARTLRLLKFEGVRVVVWFPKATEGNRKWDIGGPAIITLADQRLQSIASTRVAAVAFE